MAKTNPDRVPPPEVEKAVARLSSEFENRLLAKAVAIARGRNIDVTAEHVDEAYDQLLKSKTARAKAVIVVQRQFRYNRFWEWTTFAMACFLFAIGAAALLYGFFGSPEIGVRITTVLHISSTAWTIPRPLPCCAGSCSTKWQRTKAPPDVR